LSKETESAELILKLYELRREETMREGRKWFLNFMPSDAAEILQAMVDPKTSGYYRMVLSYWDMAASFVNRGAIDKEMFIETSSEAFVVFSKVEPFIEEVRATMGNPAYAKNLEELVMSMPDAKEGMAKRREMIKRMIEAREKMAESNYSR